MSTIEFTLKIGSVLPIQQLGRKLDISSEEIKLVLTNQMKEHFLLFGSTPYSLEYSRKLDDYILRAGPIIGKINCNIFSIIIEPKFSNLDIGKCLQLAHYSKAFNLVNHNSDITTESVSDTDILTGIDYFSQAFLNSVQDCINNGLITVFTEQTITSRDLKGKLAINKYVSKSGNPLNPIINYSHRDNNCFSNSIIKLAINICIQKCKNNNLRMLANRLSTQFIKCDDILDVANIDFTNSLSTIPRPDYERALSLSSIIINGFASIQGSESHFSPYFTMDLDVLFEAYCSFELQVILSKNLYSVNLQSNTPHKFSPLLGAQSICPDIVVTPIDKNLKSIVLDTKNKFSLSSLEQSKISNSDIFQIYYYSEFYNSNVGILVYPSDERSYTKYPLKGSEGDASYKIKKQKIIDSMLNSGKDIFELQSKDVFYLVTWRVNLSGTLHDTRHSLAQLCQFIADVSTGEVLQ